MHGVLTGQSGFDGQTHGQHRHQRFVGHRIDDGADDSLQLPAPSDPAVDEICDASIGEEAKGPGIGIMDD